MRVNSFSNDEEEKISTTTSKFSQQQEKFPSKRRISQLIDINPSGLTTVSTFVL